MYNLVIYSLAIFVIGAAACRLDLISLKEHKPLWGFMYVAFIGFAASAIADRLETDSSSFADLFGLVGCTLNLLLTRKLWEDNVPPYLSKA